MVAGGKCEENHVKRSGTEAKRRREGGERKCPLTGAGAAEKMKL
jgi:hypothetical protein